MKKIEDNIVGMPVRVIAGIMAGLMYLVIYKIITDPKPFSDKPLELQFYAVVFFMALLLATLTIGALYGKVPKYLMKLLSGGRYKG